MLIGSAQYGKTNVLQTIIRDLAERYTSKQVNIYILDFGSMILKNLEKLDHIGGVVVSSEEERVSNLFKLLMSEVARRKERLATEGVSSFTSYLEAGFSDLPQIVFMIDNLTAFQQLFPDENDALLTLSRDGCTVGVSIVVANSQTSGIGFKYLTNFAQRVALYCNDSGEYTTLFDRSRITPENLPGRSLVEIDHEIYEAQIFLAFEGEREIDRVTAMRSYVEAMNRKTGGAKAKPIPVVPEIVTSKTLLAIDGNCIDTPYQIPYGMNYSNMRIEKINLLQSGILALSGREESGKTNFVISLLGLINSNIFTHLTNAYILDDSRRKLSSTNDLGFVEGYTTDITTAKDWLSAFHSELLDRKQRVASDNRTIDEVLADDPLLMLVVSGQENIGELLQDSKINDRILSFIKEFRKYKVFIILCGVENASIPYSAPGVLKYIKESKDIIFFDDIGNIRFIDVPVKLQREYSKEISVGDAYSCIGGKLVKARTVLAK